MGGVAFVIIVGWGGLSNVLGHEFELWVVVGWGGVGWWGGLSKNLVKPWA